MRLKNWWGLILLEVLITVSSCENDGLYDPVPYVLVDIPLDLNRQDFAALRRDGGSVEILGGSRGIIVYRENALTYRAFDKHSPIPTDRLCLVSVHPSGFYMQDSCEGITFDFNGNPLGGASVVPMKQYATRVEGHILYITNE